MSFYTHTLFPVPDRDEKILRVRHYKQTEAQEYMQRKRQQRLKQEQEQKLAHQQREAKKQQNLANLMKNARKHISVAQQKGDIKADNKRVSIIGIVILYHNISLLRMACLRSNAGRHSALDLYDNFAARQWTVYCCNQVIV